MSALKIFILVTSRGQSDKNFTVKSHFSKKYRLMIFRKEMSLYGQEEDKFKRISNVECLAEEPPPLHVMMNVHTLAQPLE